MTLGTHSRDRGSFWTAEKAGGPSIDSQATNQGTSDPAPRRRPEPSKESAPAPPLKYAAAPSGAPGSRLARHEVSHPVISCDEAARARGIPLAYELKTLLLTTDVGLIAAHLPGDGRVALRRVKEYLRVRQAHLASREVISRLGLAPGTVSAVREPVWSLPHLVTHRLLDLSLVATNDGTDRGYYLFPPSLLLEAAVVATGDFES